MEAQIHGLTKKKDLCRMEYSLAIRNGGKPFKLGIAGCRWVEAIITISFQHEPQPGSSKNSYPTLQELQKNKFCSFCS